MNEEVLITLSPLSPSLFPSYSLEHDVIYLSPQKHDILEKNEAFDVLRNL